MAFFKFFSFFFKSLVALFSAFLAFFCSLVSTFFLAPIPAAAETPLETPALTPTEAELTEAALAGAATTPAINESEAAKATTNLVKRERNFISNPQVTGWGKRRERLRSLQT